jgi:hypothetical protein
MAERAAGAATDHVYDEPVEEDPVKFLAAMIVNHGRYTITGIDARFSPDGESIIPHRRFKRLPDFDDLPDGLRSGFSRLADDKGYGDMLAPRDAAMRFESDGVDVNHISGPYPVVRWTDRWGQRWEHKKGDVRKIDDSASWAP